MGDREREQRHQQQQQQRAMTEDIKSMIPHKGPTTSQAVTVATLFPVGGLLLTLSCLALTASVIGLAVLTPVFLLFSPVLVPAALLMGLAVAGFLTSGALGLGGLSSLACLARTVKGVVGRAPEEMEQAKRRMAEMAAQAGQRTKEGGQAIQIKAQEVAGRT